MYVKEPKPIPGGGDVDLGRQKERLVHFNEICFRRSIVDTIQSLIECVKSQKEDIAQLKTEVQNCVMCNYLQAKVADNAKSGERFKR